MRTLRLSRTAEQDLEEIWIYSFSTWNEEQAGKYTALIEKGFHQILANPYIGKAPPDIKNGYRALPVGKHLIFHCVSEEFVDVIGIPHQRMDVIKHFRG